MPASNGAPHSRRSVIPNVRRDRLYIGTLRPVHLITQSDLRRASF